MWFKDSGGSWLPIAALLLLLPGVSSAQSEGIQLEIETPANASVVGGADRALFVAGKASGYVGHPKPFDIVVVLDQSSSTGEPSGRDLNGNGIQDPTRCHQRNDFFGLLPWTPRRCKPSPDSAYMGAISAVYALLEQLDPATTRVGLIRFGGDYWEGTPDAFAMTQLTNDYDRVRKGLVDLAESDIGNGTNFQAALEEGMRQLAGDGRELPALDDDRRKIIAFISDGDATLPALREPDVNDNLALQEAATAARFGVRIETYAIGADVAERRPQVMVDMARMTGGRFTPVGDPRDLIAMFEGLNFADIERVRVRNRTTDREAEYTLNAADGRFAALVDTVDGENTIEVQAQATDGLSRTETVTVNFVGDATNPKLSQSLLNQRNRLLESRLSDLRSGGVAQRRSEEIRRALEIRMEQERARTTDKDKDKERKVGIHPEE